MSASFGALDAHRVQPSCAEAMKIRYLGVGAPRALTGPIMSKKTKKLSLKKETLRTLTADQLAQANGGTDAVMIRVGGPLPPPPGSFGCTLDGIYFNFNIKY